MFMMAVVIVCGNISEFFERKYLEEAKKMKETVDDYTLNNVFFAHWYT